MFRLETKIRYSEGDRSGVLSLDSLIRLFQDYNYLHADARGYGTDTARRLGATWFLLSWRLDLLRMPKVGESVCLSGWFYEERGSLSRKALLLQDAAGNPCAEGDTLWAYVDAHSRRLAVPPPNVWQAEDHGEPPALPKIPRRLAVPQGGIAAEPLTVPADGIDTNGHLNNVVFARMAHAVAGSPALSRFRAEYRKEAREGDWILPRVIRSPEKTLVCMDAPLGEPYALFQFEA